MGGLSAPKANTPSPSARRTKRLLLAQGLLLDQTASLAAPRPFCPTSPTCLTCLTCPTSPPAAAKVPRTTDRLPGSGTL
ncbi:MAG: hypothetical protein IJZ19_02290, partial [Lentisphaeria bacterium]|nr:hypothetical protein [Lentisphaeria bacterium]